MKISQKFHYHGKKILGKLSKLVIEFNSSIWIFNRVPLSISCMTNNQPVIYLCILFPKSHSAKRLKKTFCLHNPFLPFSLPHAHIVHSCKFAHPHPTLHDESVFTLSSPLAVCCSTRLGFPFSGLLWWKFHNSQRDKAFKTFPKGIGLLICVLFQDPKDLTLHDFYSLY